MEHKKAQVEVWREKISIPTYEVGKPNKNPMFLEKRVYQGSSGKVYPCPVIDQIFDEKIDKVYNAVWLENDYLRVMILPELGGRIQRAYDKTSGYDFVYYNEVIKPALVGLTGPWISGGIEFNWPQHHRPTTYCPVDCVLSENADGSKTVRVSETDRMYGTKGMASFTLYPDKAFIEIKGQLYNPTPMAQTFLWWANPAVPVNDNTQSIFPPDVTAVMDHGKRDVSKFPIATGVYYKHDYGAGVDISRYKNIPVPTSYMAFHSDANFVGGYDYGVESGILHIADHHISPGKKQWTWGSGEFGKAWDRNLTDENGPYIELMTGIFTDNQPDFTWLKPFEEKQFTQYFMPYKKVGNVKNASTEVVLGLECEGDCTSLCVYATAMYENSRVVLQKGEQILFEKTGKLSPINIIKAEVDTKGAKPEELTLAVYAEDGRLLLDYKPKAPSIEAIPAPATAAKQPRDIATAEQLYLTGVHIEQYRHATYLPDEYYLEGLRRDAGDSRNNNAYGMLLFRRGLFAESEVYFRTAIERITAMSPNPYDSEPYYNLGLCLLYQGKDSEAFDAFYKAVWSSAEQESGFYYMAAIAAKRADYSEAYEYIERSLIKNSHNTKARGLKARLLCELGRNAEAKAYLEESLAIDPFDYLSRFELFGFDNAETLGLMRDDAATFISVAVSYGEWGQYASALSALNACTANSPMVAYYSAYYMAQSGQDSKAALAKARAASTDYCFPNTLEDILVLEYAVAYDSKDARAAYYLGNLWYDKRQYQKAQTLWEQSAAIDGKFPTVWRNLAFAYFNKVNDLDKAQTALETAFNLDKTDARVFLELDQLYLRRGMSCEKRIANYEANVATFEQRDDLWVEYITLLNLIGKYDQALARMKCHKFHPWEGGEGKITAQYTLSHIELARIALAESKAAHAVELLQAALTFPENLGEGKLEGATDNNIYYYLGCASEALGDTAGAKSYWQKASTGGGEPAGAMYYNDQPADRILYQGLALRKLGREGEASGRFHKLVDYGEKHIFDEVSIDYFAVSLPDLQLFNEDLTLRNKAHCNYLIALGSYGLCDYHRAQKACTETLQVNCAHIGAVEHQKLFSADVK